MIRNAKNYTKKKKDSTLGQMAKAKLYIQNHTKKHIHPLTKREKGKKYIYIKKYEENNKINKEVYQ